MRQFQPSGYGASEGDVALDTAKVTAAAAGGVVTGAAAASSITTLLVAGGVAATVPVVGWITAGVLAAAAGTVALVMALKQGKIRKDEAIAAAKKLGMGSYAELVPAFTVGALKWPKARREKVLARMEKQYAKMKGKKGVFPKLYAKDVEKLAAKIKILKAIAKANAPKSARKKLSPEDQRAIAIAEQSPTVAPTAAQSSITIGEGGSLPGESLIPGVPTWALAAGGAGVGLILILLLSGRRGTARAG